MKQNRIVVYYDRLRQGVSLIVVVSMIHKKSQIVNLVGR